MQFVTEIVSSYLAIVSMGGQTSVKQCNPPSMFKPVTARGKQERSSSQAFGKQRVLS